MSSFALTFIETHHLEDDDVLDELEEEIAKCTSLFERLVVSVTDRELLQSQLITQLGGVYNTGISEQLQALPSWDLKNFMTWYLKWLFVEEEEGDDAEEGEDAGGGKTGGGVGEFGEDGGGKAGGGAGDWSGVSWKTKPLAVEEGVTWKCLKCRIVNKWDCAACIGCDSPAPHADTLPKATPVPAVSSAGGITASGFTFGFGVGEQVESIPMEQMAWFQKSQKSLAYLRQV